MKLKSKIKLRIAPFAGVLMLGLFLTDRSGVCIATLLAATVHEIGHLMAAKCLKIPIKRLCLDFFGARMDAFGRLISYREELLLCAAGPFVSFCFSSLLFLIGGHPLVQVTAVTSFLLGLLNIFPIRGFDGGRMLCCFFSIFWKEKTAETILQITSLFFTFFLWWIAVYFLLKIGDGISLFSFTMSLLSRLIISKDS